MIRSRSEMKQTQLFFSHREGPSFCRALNERTKLEITEDFFASYYLSLQQDPESDFCISWFMTKTFMKMFMLFSGHWKCPIPLQNGNLAQLTVDQAPET